MSENTDLANVANSIRAINETPVSGANGLCRRLAVVFHKVHGPNVRADPSEESGARIRSLTTAVLAESIGLLEGHTAEEIAANRTRSKGDLRADLESALADSPLTETVETDDGGEELRYVDGRSAAVRDSIGPHAAGLVAYGRQVHGVDA